MNTGSGSKEPAGKSPGLLKGQDGVIMLEFVFVVSILMVIFLATVTFSFLYRDYYSVQKVAREGAREASITRNADWGRVKALQAASLWGLDQNNILVDIHPSGSTVTCTVNYVSRPFNRTFPKMLEGSPLKDFNLSASAVYVWSSTM